MLHALKKKALYGLLFLSFSSTIQAQTLAQAKLVEETPKGFAPKFAIWETKAPQFDAASLKKFLNLPAEADLQMISQETDGLGFTHHRYQEWFAGYPIEDAIYIVHEKNGEIKAINGVLAQNFPAELLQAKSNNISFEQALSAAKNHIGADLYKWEMAEEEEFLKRESGKQEASFYPQLEKVWVAEQDITVGDANFKLAYKMDIYAHEPMSRHIVYIDAVTGKVLNMRNRICEHKHDHTTETCSFEECAPEGLAANAVGSAVTGFSGTQTITTDSYNGSYRLRETGRGNGINTYNLKKGTSYTSAVDFTDADNSWNNVNTALDQYATDAHWGAEKTYDYFKNTYNRNSIDNAGMALNSYVHYSANYVNAYWDGTRMTYGDGNSTYKPLTSLDIAGHEITHGLTEKTANLTYSYESGALNEGFSDIFGTVIEFYGKPSGANWLIGENIGAAFRSMSNPNAYSQPDTYQGSYWATGTSDNGGVHTNSGVLNFWFYVLSQGGSGTNDKGSAYSVTSIGMTKAAAIAFRTLTVYLTASSNYAACRTAAIQSATDLYGAGSQEVISTTNAWYAVGVGAAYSSGGTTTCGVPSGLSATSISSTGATLNWASTSATSYNVRYKATTSTTWITTTSTTTSKAITGLTASTTYEFQVQSVCTTSSAYSASTTFTTTAATGSCTDAYEANNTASAAKTMPTNTNITALLNTSTDKDYFKFTTSSTATKVRIDMTNLPADYDVRLYYLSGSSLVTVATSQNSNTTSEAIIYNTTTARTYYVYVYGYNGTFNASSCYTLRASTSGTNFFTGSLENDGLKGDIIEETSMNLYPNPTKDIVHISLNKSTTNSNLTVTDIMGRIVHTQYIGENPDGIDMELNLGHLSNGLYFLRLNDQPVQKLILQK